MKNSSTISSKSQITVPQEIRRRLGQETGDRAEFVLEQDRTVIRPVRSEVNPFEKFIGIADPFPRRGRGNKGPSTICEALNLSALKGEDSQATLRITTLTLAPEGSHRPHASGF
jgi:antitoxin PrlF